MGLIAGAFGHHSLEALVSVPAWVTIATAALFVVALMKSCDAADGRLKVLAALTGAVAGCTLPNSAPTSWQSVVTHAAVHSSHNDLFEALDILDTRPATLMGKRIWVTGGWRPQDGDNLATVSQRVMACCAADAVNVGFDVLPAHTVAIPLGVRVRVAGIVSELLRQGETRYVLRDAAVEAASAESSAAR